MHPPGVKQKARAVAKANGGQKEKAQASKVVKERHFLVIPALTNKFGSTKIGGTKTGKRVNMLKMGLPAHKMGRMTGTRRMERSQKMCYWRGLSADYA